MPNNKAQAQALSWYGRWKAFPYHSQVHWLALVVLVWVLGLAFMGQLVNFKNAEKQLAQAEVLGVRTSRPAQTVNTNSSPAQYQSGTGSVVKGEAVGPCDCEKECPGQVLGKETERQLLPSEIEKQGIFPARNMNEKQ